MESKDWSSLPWDMLHEITNRLGLSGQIHCSSVCTEWHASITHHRPALFSRRPWLLLQDDSPEGSTSSVNFCIPAYPDPDSHRLVSLRLPNRFQGWSVSGTSRGWLLMTLGARAALLNPISHVHVPLADLFLPDYTVKITKVILSSTPTCSGCVAAVVLAHSYSSILHQEKHVGVARLGEGGGWTWIRAGSWLRDVALCDGGDLLKLLGSDGDVIHVRRGRSAAVTRTKSWRQWAVTNLVSPCGGRSKEMKAVLMRRPQWSTLFDWWAPLPRLLRISDSGKICGEGGDDNVLLADDKGFVECGPLKEDRGIWEESCIHHFVSLWDDGFEWKVYSKADGSLLKTINLPKYAFSMIWFVPNFTGFA